MPQPTGGIAPITMSEFMEHWRTFQRHGMYTFTIELELTSVKGEPSCVIVARGKDHMHPENAGVPHPEEMSIMSWPNANHKHILAQFYWLLNDIDSRIAAARHLRAYRCEPSEPTS